MRHSRAGGNPGDTSTRTEFSWIPVFTGMTSEVITDLLLTMTHSAKQIITLTPSALERVRFLMTESSSNENSQDSPIIGLRVGVKSKGCSGMSYVINYATDIKPGEDVISYDEGHVKILIEPTATLYLIGCTMDYEESELNSQFTFINPNEKARCGCGESFHI